MISFNLCLPQPNIRDFQMLSHCLKSQAQISEIVRFRRNDISTYLVHTFFDK